MQTWKSQNYSKIHKEANQQGTRFYTVSFNAQVFIDCLKDFIKYRKKPAFVITNRRLVHKCAKVKIFIESLQSRLSIFLLPSYAPDLKPDELVWNYIRQTGSARMPLKKDELSALRYAP